MQSWNERTAQPLDIREERPFDADCAAHGGYRYTTGQSLSSRIAVDRQTRQILDAYHFGGKSVLDIGCGDAAITIDLYDRASPSSIEGVDPSAGAVGIGQTRVGGRRIRLSVGNACDLRFADNAFDVAHLRGVLHHMDTPHLALREAARVARSVIVLEPNGYNPVLKVIEKLSAYHRAHGERSFPATTIDAWIVQAGFTITHRSFGCLVPYFCPDIIARSLRAMEPAVEAIPFLRQIACGAYVAVGHRPPHNEPLGT